MAFQLPQLHIRGDTAVASCPAWDKPEPAMPLPLDTVGRVMVCQRRRSAWGWRLRNTREVQEIDGNGWQRLHPVVPFVVLASNGSMKMLGRKTPV